MINFTFGMQIDIEVLFKLVLSIWSYLDMPKVPKISLHTFAVSLNSPLQYAKRLTNLIAR